MKSFNVLKFGVAALCALVSSNVSAGQSGTDVTVVLKNGGQEVINVDSTGAMYFSNNTTLEILPSSYNDYLVALPLEEIQKLLFTYYTGVVKVLSQNEVILYPVPAESVLHIANAPESLNSVQIFDVAGKLVINTNYSDKSGIDVSTLNKGIYVLKAGEITAKFEKK